jgi:O-antigen ligase
MPAGPQAPTGATATTSNLAAGGQGRFEPAALIPLAVLTVIWCWWGAKDGGFFGTVLLPGTIALCAGLVLLLATAPWRGDLRLPRAAAVALWALVGLGAWNALSAIWSPAPDVAIADAQRVLAYTIALGLGIWLCDLLGPRTELSLVPLAAAGTFAGAVATIALLAGDDLRTYLEPDGTLQFPLGYRNANAAFFLIAVWPAIGLAAYRKLDWRLRALALGAATLCLDLGLLGQSRGSILAMGAALAVYLAASPRRARALLWLVLAALPALGVVPALVDLYDAANEAGPLGSAIGEMRDAGRAVVFTTAVAVAVGAAAALSERRVPEREGPSATADRVVIGGLAVAVLAGAVAFVAVVGDPVDWLGQRAAEFRSGESPSAAGRATRFSLNAGSGRSELWRVALVEAGEDPLLGDGAGGYRYSYLQERRAAGFPAVRDAHSVELENLSELGAPGLALFLCAVGGAGAGAVRARRAGPAAASLSAIALTAGAYWLVHASLDWFWPYPAITAPVLALVGSACAPGLRVARVAAPGPGRRWLVAAAAVLALSTIGPFLSERYTDSAYSKWRSDPADAYDDLDAARRLNPLSVDPLLAEGAIARSAGDRERAIDAFGDAADERPEEWAPYYFLAQLHRGDNPRLARREAALAQERDPFNAQVKALQRRLERDRHRG